MADGRSQVVVPTHRQVVAGIAAENAAGRKPRGKPKHLAQLGLFPRQRIAPHRRDNRGNRVEQLIGDRPKLLIRRLLLASACILGDRRKFKHADTGQSGDTGGAQFDFPKKTGNLHYP